MIYKVPKSQKESGCIILGRKIPHIGRIQQQN